MRFTAPLDQLTICRLRLNQDLKRLSQWLYDHRQTPNVSNSKFMLTGSSRKLRSLDEAVSKTKDAKQDRVSSYKYLGVIINNNLSW